jgi:hypothetical protein
MDNQSINNIMTPVTTLHQQDQEPKTPERQIIRSSKFTPPPAPKKSSSEKQSR